MFFCLLKAMCTGQQKDDRTCRLHREHTVPLTYVRERCPCSKASSEPCQSVLLGPRVLDAVWWEGGVAQRAFK